MSKQKSSYFYSIFSHFRKSFLNMFGAIIVLILIFTALLSPFLAESTPVYVHHQEKTYFPILNKVWPLSVFKLYPELHQVDFDAWEKAGATVLYPPIPYAPEDYDLNPKATLSPPSVRHWLGTDLLGRDILSRMIHGSKVSLAVGLVAVSIYSIIGIFLGALAGYFGGRFDMLLSRFIEIVMCFPTFFLILALLAILGRSIFYVMFIIGLTGWPGIARLTRGEFLKLRNSDFIAACRASGMSHWRIIRKHLLPNSLTPVFVSISFGIASAILIESSLSFLGFGVPPPTPSWGDTLSKSRSYIEIAWWLTVFPGAAIFLTVTSFNLVGEGLRDALDPRLRERNN